METNLRQFRNSLTYSQRRSRSLLAAWNSGNLESLEAALHAVTELPAAATFEEEERREMVAEVEGTLRTWLQESAGTNEVALLTSLKLLHHLAGRDATGGAPELSPRIFQAVECMA